MGVNQTNVISCEYESATLSEKRFKKHSLACYIFFCNCRKPHAPMKSTDCFDRLFESSRHFCVSIQFSVQFNRSCLTCVSLSNETKLFSQVKHSWM